MKLTQQQKILSLLNPCDPATTTSPKASPKIVSRSCRWQLRFAFAVRAFDSVRAQHAGAFSRPVWRAGAGRAAIVQGTATCTSTIGTTTTQPTESSCAVSRPRPRCGNYSAADQTNANAGDRQQMVSHTSPAAALPSAWGAGRFQAEGPEISYLQLVRNVIAWRVVCRNQFTTKSS
jgi:hypothetical protein